MVVVKVNLALQIEDFMPNWAFASFSNCLLSTQDTGGASKTEEEEEEVLDEETLRRDQAIKGAIDILIREYASELNAPSQDSDSQPRNKKRKEKKEEVCQCWVVALPVTADLSQGLLSA